MAKSTKTTGLPETDSIQELAKFWDAHDLTDFEDALEEVAEPVFEQDNVVSCRLDRKNAEALRALAAARGIDDAQLIREWILERLQAS